MPRRGLGVRATPPGYFLHQKSYCRICNERYYSVKDMERHVKLHRPKPFYFYNLLPEEEKQKQRKRNEKYLNSEKGKLTMKKYHESERFKILNRISQRKSYLKKKLQRNSNVMQEL